MDSNFERMPGVPVATADSVQPIVSLPEDTVVRLMPAASAEPPDYPRRFGTPEQNSRLGTALPQGVWAPRFQVPVRGLANPRDVLVLGDRIVLRSDDGFALYDTDGEFIGNGALSQTAVLLDPADGLLFGVDQRGMLAAWRLSSGEVRFRMILLLPGEFTRIFLDRPGDLYLASVETGVPPHSGLEPSRSLVERYSLGAMDVDANGSLLTAERRGELVRSRSDLLMARHQDTFVLAIEDSLLRADASLAVQAQLTGSFRPQALSLDEAGRAWLVATTGTGPELWAIEPDGRRLFATPLPRTSAQLLAPPIVSHHHLAYLVYRDRILAFESDGRPAWQWSASTVGATLTADDRLLVAAGREVRSIGAGGPGDLLVTLPEPIVTPPILSAGGLLLVASADTLYAFVAAGGRQ